MPDPTRTAGEPREAPLWRPSPERAAASALAAFQAGAAAAAGAPSGGLRELHRWSVAEPARFWRALWDFLGILGEPGTPTLAPRPDSPRAARWFPAARLSFAENLLRGDPARPALVARREDGLRRAWTLAELRADVERWAGVLAASGVRAGDRVAAWLPNGGEAVCAFLATARLGAVWSSCSPDFGPQGVLDRFQAIAPKLLIATDGHVYKGRRHDARARLEEIRRGLPSLEGVVVVPWLGTDGALPAGARRADEALASAAPAPAPERFPFEHPLCIVFSSGTTGKPKCIVHGAGGTLLQHGKEHRLHADVRAGDRVFFHSTLGWMMWNWIVSALASEATLVLYDGDPLYPTEALVNLAAEERLSFFGCSAKYYEVLAQEDLRPAPLPHLRTVASTGSPLAPESFDWIQARLGHDVHLASISGGTDILSCFVGGDPTGPVWRGEIQAPGLGMDVDVVDAEGKSVRGRAGELVCRPPFPSMPLGFWDDPDDARYRRAYFERFPGLWHHGDWARWTEHGGIEILGRSDATLNVHGVRIGTAEIYRELEAFPELREAVAVECARPGCEGIAVLVVLRPGAVLDDGLRARIRTRLRERMSPRHVPRHLVAVPDLPRTRSNKLSETAVRDALHGRDSGNAGALANPQALEALRGLELD